MAVAGAISISSGKNSTVNSMSSPQLRTLWISDVHLGFKECKAE
ncbi:MAG TPA: UDP-2,3-diacylglucosamine hydrolase, partial [Gammaproteobacteria bacterium]|nr:UDP-2,3-diacylglucosamine hydrolase [Gammaproteobacteria bacterium]